MSSTPSPPQMSSCLSCGGEAGAGMTCSHHRDQHYCSYKCALKHPCFESVGTKVFYKEFSRVRDALDMFKNNDYKYVLLYDQRTPDEPNDMSNVLLYLKDDKRTVINMLTQRIDYPLVDDAEVSPMTEYVKTLTKKPYRFLWTFSVEDFPYVFHELSSTYKYSTKRSHLHNKERNPLNAFRKMINDGTLPFFTMSRAWKGVKRDVIFVYQPQGDMSRIEVEFDKDHLPDERTKPVWLKHDSENMEHRYLYHINVRKITANDLHRYMVLTLGYI